MDRTEAARQRDEEVTTRPYQRRWATTITSYGKNLRDLKLGAAAILAVALTCTGCAAGGVGGAGQGAGQGPATASASFGARQSFHRTSDSNSSARGSRVASGGP